MSRTDNLARNIWRHLSFRRKTNKSKKSIAPLLIASVALVAAVAFSVSVESRSGGWLRRALSTAPHSEAKVTKNSPSSVALTLVSPATPLAPTVTATKTEALLTDLGDNRCHRTTLLRGRATTYRRASRSNVLIRCAGRLSQGHPTKPSYSNPVTEPRAQTPRTSRGSEIDQLCEGAASLRSARTMMWRDWFPKNRPRVW